MPQLAHLHRQTFPCSLSDSLEAACTRNALWPQYSVYFEKTFLCVFFLSTLSSLLHARCHFWNWDPSTKEVTPGPRILEHESPGQGQETGTCHEWLPHSEVEHVHYYNSIGQCYPGTFLTFSFEH